MSRIILDIETTGVQWESLDHAQQEEMLKFSEDDEEIERAKKGLTFSPLTGEAVAIGLLNPDTNRGVVYFRSAKERPSTNSGSNSYSPREGPSTNSGNNNYSLSEVEGYSLRLEPVADERELLEKFWADIKNYTQLISFNGRTFDGPFLHIRSAILGIHATKQLVPYRYGNEHIDLLDQLTFLGAARRAHFTLDMVCKAFGIQSPKSGGITGDDVPRLFREGKCEDIARYCAGDLIATQQLFEKWERHISPI